MLKMSIKKKQAVVNRYPISRKKLFQFLFKNYIKNAYCCGVSKLQQSQHQNAACASVHGVCSCLAARKKEFRSEYFNDMSECFTAVSSVSRDGTLKAAKPMTTSKITSSSMRRASMKTVPGVNEAVLIKPTMTVTQPTTTKFDQNDDIGWGKETNVCLVREPTASFGVCIVGGKVNISKGAHVTGIFIKNIIAGSPAEKCNQIKIGDRILSVNKNDVRQASQEETINLIKHAGCSIALVLQSFDGTSDSQKTSGSSVNVTTEQKSDKTGSTSHHQDEQSGPATQTSAETGPTLVVVPKINSTSDDSSSDDEDDEETSGKVLTKAGFEIDRKSAGNLRRTKEEAAADDEPENNYGYTEKKLKKRYGGQGGATVVRAYLQRDSNNSLGLALAGHRNRNQMGCFVAGINPKGSAGSQNVQIGDEICEINGVFLHKLCHLNASVIIKGIPGVTFEFILLRTPNAADEIAVKPVISFPSAFDQFDQLYSCFKNVRNVTIQKVGTSLGIMIIEGKHSDVGQGIFISDIQENSNAENAGVKIGEMILAVNKDLLIDTNYDTAAGLLKRAEGIVTLTLCNPNKKEEADVTGAGEDPNKVGVEKIEASKIPEPVPEPEVSKDPATDPIAVNKETNIELNADSKPLGIVVVKGDSTQVQVGASVILIHPNGAVSRDGRLQPFDKIIEIDGKKISSETSDNDLKKIFQHLYAKVKMTIYRADPPDIKEMEVDVAKKSGKDIGMGFAECTNNGIYVTEITPGGIIDMDHRMIKGDIITHINGDDIRKSNFIDCSIVLKAALPKISFKVIRPKGKK